MNYDSMPRKRLRFAAIKLPFFILLPWILVSTGCDLIEISDGITIRWEHVNENVYHHPIATDHALYGVLHDEIVRSSDAGSTWTNIFTSRQPEDYVHAVSNLAAGADGAVYAIELARQEAAWELTSNQLFRLDREGDWSLILENPEWHSDSSIGPIAAVGDSIVYLAAKPARLEKTVYRSTDGSDTWGPTGLTTVPNRGEFTNLFATEAGSVIAVAGSRTYVSTDHGHNWQIIERGFYALEEGDEQGEIWGTSSDFMTDVGEFVPGVYRSLDGGLTWSRTNFPIVESITGPGSLKMSGLTVTKQGHVYAAVKREYSGGVFRTRDGGNEWEVVNEGLPATADGGNLAMVLSLVIAPDGRLLATTSGGVFRTREPVE